MLMTTQGASARKECPVIPTEIHHQFADLCSSNDLTKLCRLSKAFNINHTEKLYACVDIRYDALHDTCRSADDRDNGCYDKQSRLLQTLKRHPDYARHVKELRWTSVHFEDHECEYFYPLLPTYSKAKPQGLWEIFALFTEVTHIEISEVYSLGSWYYDIPKDLCFFPKLSSVSLVGELTESLVQLVLPIDRACQLKHLSMRNFRMLHQGGPSKTTDTPRFLKGLTGKCASLRNLEIMDDLSGDGHPDNAVEAVWLWYKRLLGSVTETLETFAFKNPAYIRHPDTFESTAVTTVMQRALNGKHYPNLRQVTILSGDEHEEPDI